MSAIELLSTTKETELQHAALMAETAHITSEHDAVALNEAERTTFDTLVDQLDSMTEQDIDQIAAGTRAKASGNSDHPKTEPF